MTKDTAIARSNRECHQIMWRDLSVTGSSKEESTFNYFTPDELERYALYKGWACLECDYACEDCPIDWAPEADKSVSLCMYPSSPYRKWRDATTEIERKHWAAVIGRMWGLERELPSFEDIEDNIRMENINESVYSGNNSVHNHFFDYHTMGVEAWEVTKDKILKERTVVLTAEQYEMLTFRVEHLKKRLASANLELFCIYNSPMSARWHWFFNGVNVRRELAAAEKD